MDNKFDFAEALTAGLSAAEDAARAMDEVKSVIVDAASSVEKVTNNTLSLFLDATSIEKLSAFTSTVVRTMGLEPRPQVIRQHGIFVGHLMGHGPKSHIERAERICLLRFGIKTYPVVVEWEDTTNVCNDIDTVRSAISQVLRDARVGRIFQQLLKNYPATRAKPPTDPVDDPMATITKSKNTRAGQNVVIEATGIRELMSHVNGTISVGQLYDTYFELRVPIVDITGIPLCKIPFSDVDFAIIDQANTSLTIRLSSTITWDGSDLHLRQ